jgi:hypothetical protein
MLLPSQDVNFALLQRNIRNALRIEPVRSPEADLDDAPARE